MKKGTKIALISTASVVGLVLLVAAVALWLVFSPKQLTRIANRLAAQYINAESHFDRVDLTLFRTFPDAGLRVDNLYIVNPTPGAPSDTLARVGSLTVGVDVKKYLKEKEVVVHQVLIDDVEANLYIGPEGQTNFDIFPSSDEVDTTSSSFSLDSLPNMDLRKIKISRLDATLANEASRMQAEVRGLGLRIAGQLREGLMDADIDLDSRTIALATRDSLDSAALTLSLAGLDVALDAKGSTAAAEGKLKLAIDNGALAVGGQQMVNENLAQSKRKLLSVSLPFAYSDSAGCQRVQLAESRLSLDRYGLTLAGGARIDSLCVDLAVATEGSWPVAELLQVLPMQVLPQGMDVDANVELQATARGPLTDSLMPTITATAALRDGSFSYPSALPYKVNKISGKLNATVHADGSAPSNAEIHDLRAHTRGTDITLNGTANDLLGDMLVDATLRGSMPLADAKPMLPADMPLSIADGKAALDLRARLRMSDLERMALERMQASGTVRLSSVDVTYDSIHATSPSLDIALQLPAKEHAGSLADAHISGTALQVEMPSINGTLEKPDVNVGVNNPLRDQLAATFAINLGETEANVDSMMVSLGALQLKGSMRMDSTQSNPLRQFNPVVDIDMHSAVLYMPELPDAVRLSQFTFAYSPESCELSTAEVKLGHSDFQLYGTIENLEQWLDKKEVLRADMNFTSSYADVDQIMDMMSGMGSDADSLEQMRVEDEVPAEANPFIVPKDIDITLHTHIKRSVAFGNDLNDVAGELTINDGVAILNQMGFVCKAATMQLTALYKSPRPNNLFVALDFHLLDIEIDELLDMIPAVDTLVPMLAAFDGNANFHLAAETYLNASYQPKMSTLLGSAAISGRDLVVMDNSAISQIAKLMQFKSWKDKDDKIRIDSLDVEMTCFRKEIEVFPFVLNMGKYQLCASGKHTLDNQCGYHIELLKNPLMAKVGVDVRGDLSSPKISLGEVRYADLYKPERQGVVEKQTLELKRMIREALEANVR